LLTKVWQKKCLRQEGWKLVDSVSLACKQGPEIPPLDKDLPLEQYMVWWPGMGKWLWTTRSMLQQIGHGLPKMTVSEK